MGFPPPKDAPPPEEQDQKYVDAGFQPSPTGATLCGWGWPMFGFSITLPSFSFGLDFPPDLNFAIRLNCDLSDPIEADFNFGGGRVGTTDVDSDDEYVVQ